MDILDNLLQDGTCPFPEEYRSSQVELLVAQFKDAFEGDPWFGRNLQSLISEVDETEALQRPSGQHSILELVWHMINWKEFALNRLNHTDADVQAFETNDWRPLDHTDSSLWQEGKKRLFQLQEEFLEALEAREDDFLFSPVAGRDYSFRKLLHGVLQHDIYHLGQIAYIKKLLSQKQS